MNVGFRTLYSLVFFVLLTGGFTSCNTHKPLIQSTLRQSTVAVTHTAMPQHGVPYPVIPQKDFIRNWSGSKKCNGSMDETPSSVQIMSKDSVSLYLSGLIDGTLIGNTRGYMVLIPLQSSAGIPGNSLEGSFTLANDRATLRAFFNITVHGHTDTCSATYHLEK